MRVISLVVEGLEQARDAGLFKWLTEQDADIICLQDTQCSEYSLNNEEFFPSQYNAYFLDHYDDHRKNGVVIYCRELPKAIMSGLGFIEFDSQGLYIQADYRQLSVGSLLMPSGLGSDEALNTKLKFMQALGDHLQKIRAKRRDFIICGGWELTSTPTDIEDAVGSVGIPGCSTIEQVWLQTLYKNGYCDAFRAYTNDPDEFTWWPGGDEAGSLRTDTHVVSSSLGGRVDYAAIYTEEIFSSHAPIIIDYDIGG